MIGLDDRISLGVAWLDEHAPDWLDRVDTERLDLALYCGCVLGQVFSDKLTPEMDGYGYGIRPLFAEYYSASGLGFDEGAESRDGYDVLTRAWVARIEQLRAERGVRS